ncbi:SPFH domain-containing protein [Ignatzschineria sp. LJL83]
MNILIISGGVGLLIVLFFLTTRYRKIRHEGQALIVNGVGKTKASLTGTFIWPVVNRYEYMDITRKKISVNRSGRKDAQGDEYEGLHCKDNIRADLKVDFYIGVNHSEADIIRVAKLFTTRGASDPAHLAEHFQPKFSEALKTAVKQFNFEELLTNRLEFREKVIEVIGEEMDGFKIYDVVIDRIDQTAFEAHNPQNILDVEGIRKIAEITAAKNIQTNAIRQDESTNIKQKNVEATANRLQLEKQEKEAEARTKREIEVIQLQEQALTEEKNQEYLQREELARLSANEEIGKREKLMEMEIELTRIGTERQTVISQEEVNRAKGTERVKTERDISSQEIEKDAAIEEARKQVVEKRAQITEIERKIAREEEETKNLRAFETANRQKRVMLTEAEALAEADILNTAAKARAEKEAMKEESEKILLEVDAQTKREARLAENQLLVKTKEAEALLIFEENQAKAHLVMEENRAIAKERMATAVELEIQKEGFARVEVEKAESDVIRQRGFAEAEAQSARFEAAQKYDDTAREHDKWVMQLNMDKELRLSSIEANKTVNIENGRVLANALANADIKLFGGEGMREIREAVMNAATIDAKFGNSEVLSPLVDEYVSGDRSIVSDIKDVLMEGGIKSEDLTNLSSANLMKKLADNPQQLEAIRALFLQNNHSK